MRKGFWWRFALPAIIGGLGALYFLQGDTNPDATTAFTATVKVSKETTPGTGGIEVYNLTFRDGTAVTVMGSRAVPLIPFLGRRDEEWVELEIKSKPGLEKIER